MDDRGLKGGVLTEDQPVEAAQLQAIEDFKAPVSPASLLTHNHHFEDRLLVARQSLLQTGFH
jgi:hypothetical protein